MKKLIPLFLVGALGATLGITLLQKGETQKYSEVKAETDQVLAGATFSHSVDYYNGAESYLYDGDESTYYWVKAFSQGDYIQFTFDTETVIHDITVVFHETDFLRNAQVMWSTATNPDNFMLVDEWHISSPETISMNAYGVKAKVIRIASLDDNRNEHGDPSWVKFNEIKLNRDLYADELIQTISFGGFADNYLPSDLGISSLKNMIDGDPSTYTRFGAKNGDAEETYIQFDFKASVPLSSISYQNPNLWPTTNDRIYGADILYLNSNDEYVNVPSTIFYNPVISNDFYLHFFDLRSAYISTSSIKIKITYFIGWVIAGDFAFNQLDNSEKPSISYVPADSGAPTSLYNNSKIDNILNKNLTSYAWFSGHIDSLTADFGKVIYVNNVDFQTGKKDNLEDNYGDEVWVKVQYSIDGSEYTDLTNGGATHGEVDAGVFARYVRLKVTGDVGWNAFTYFIVNGRNDANASYYGFNSDSATPHMTGALQGGNINNLIDDDDTTNARFLRPNDNSVNAITLFYPDGEDITSLDIKYDKNSEEYQQQVAIDYALADGIMHRIGTYITDSTAKETAIDLSNKNLKDIHYLRIVPITKTGWVNILDLHINGLADIEPSISAVGDFVIADANYNNNLDAAIDGDLDTTVWYDYQFSKGSYFLLDLGRYTSVENIAFLQGGLTGADYRINEDKFTSCLISYSLDGNSWTDVGTYLNTANIIKNFETPINARYIKAIYNGEDELSPFGVVVREFEVNFEKQNFSISGLASEATYTGSGIKGYNYIPYGSGAVVTYNGGTTVPTNPGLYELEIEVTNSPIYNNFSNTSNLHIYDTAAHFIASWNEMLANASDAAGSICGYVAENSENALTNLIDIYDNHVTSEVRNVIASETYQDSRGIEVTIGESIAYAKAHIDIPNVQPGNYLSINENDNAVPVAIILIVAILISFSFPLLLRKKNNKNR